MYKPTPHFLAALAAAFALVCFVSVANAADVTVSGVNASQNTDGSVIPTDGSLNSLRDVRVKYGTCNTAGTAVATTENTVTLALLPAAAGQPFSIPLSGLSATKYCFQARHSNIGDQYSDFTSAVVRDLTPPLRKPGKPGSVTVAFLQEDLIVSARWVATAFASIQLNGADK